MRLLVLSDTHIPLRAKDLPPRVWDAVKEADLIVHAGDFTTIDLYYELKAYKDVKAVAGNMDGPEVWTTLPEKLIFEIEGRRIGLTHGFGAPYKLEERVKKLFEGEKLDVLIFGHSHRPLVRREGDLLLLNPGSPTDTVFAKVQTFAWLEVTPQEVRAELVQL